MQSMLPRTGRIDLYRKLDPYAFLIATGVVQSTIVLFATVWKRLGGDDAGDPG